MNKKKSFKISDDINRGFTDIMNAVKNNVGNFRYEVIALSRIETDPENPRELLTSEAEIKAGINNDDPDYETKKKEIDDLQSLAFTIKNKGLINPIAVYKLGEKYRIIAGERRFLASLLAGKDDIHAKILDSKPNELDIKVMQWIENNERSGLSLRERLSNLKSILDAYLKNNHAQTISMELLKNLTGLSKTRAFYYYSVLNGPDDLRDAINKEEINSLETANFVGNIKDQSLRCRAISMCKDGESFDSLKELINKSKKTLAHSGSCNIVRKKGRAVTYIHLGKTKAPYVIKKIVEIILSHPTYAKYSNQFTNLNWEDYVQVGENFKKLLSVVEAE